MTQALYKQLERRGYGLLVYGRLGRLTRFAWNPGGQEKWKRDCERILNSEPAPVVTLDGHRRHKGE